MVECFAYNEKLIVQIYYYLHVFYNKFTYTHFRQFGLCERIFFYDRLNSFFSKILVMDNVISFIPVGSEYLETLKQLKAVAEGIMVYESSSTTPLYALLKGYLSPCSDIMHIELNEIENLTRANELWPVELPEGFNAFINLEDYADIVKENGGEFEVLDLKGKGLPIEYTFPDGEPTKEDLIEKWRFHKAPKVLHKDIFTLGDSDNSDFL